MAESGVGTSRTADRDVDDRSTWDPWEDARCGKRKQADVDMEEDFNCSKLQRLNGSNAGSMVDDDDVEEENRRDLNQSSSDDNTARRSSTSINNNIVRQDVTTLSQSQSGSQAEDARNRPAPALRSNDGVKSTSKPVGTRGAFRTPRSVPLEEPEAFLFPVVLEDMKTGAAHFEALCPYTQPAFDAIGLKPIRRQKRLVSGKWLIDARDEKDQKKLAGTTVLGQINVKCFIPAATTQGVIRPFPLTQNTAKIRDSHPAINKVQRLKFLDRKENDQEKRFKDSKAVKVSFQLADLPKSLIIGSEVFAVVPYVEPVRRCTKCQRFDHTTERCRARVKRCPRCSKEAHGPEPCSGPLLCINCEGNHSAAWHQCPKALLRRRAHEIKATTSVPIGMALKKAREEAGDLSPKVPIYRQDNFYKFPDTVHHSGTPTPRVSYASVTGRALRPPPSQVPVRRTWMTTLSKAHSGQPSPPPQNPPTNNVAGAEDDSGAPDDSTTTLESRIASMLESFTESVEGRLRALESKPSPPHEAIVDSVVHKLQTKREQQAAELARRVSHLKKQADANPVVVVVGKLMEGVVEATVNKRPEALLSLVTDMYNRAFGERQQPPTWDGELQTLGDLALGLCDATKDSQAVGNLPVV